METWDTQDFSLAVAMFTLGHRLIEIDSSNPRRSTFRFELDTTISNHAELFFANKLTYDIRTVLMNFRTLKDRLYAGV
jgi:hypothetical protein